KGQHYDASVWKMLPNNKDSFEIDDTQIPNDAYPYILDPTMDVSIIAGANDENWIPGLPSYNNNSSMIAFGNVSGYDVNSFLLFNSLGIPSGSTIDNAYVTFIDVSALSATTVNLQIYGDTDITPTAPASYTEAEEKELTSANVDWL